MPRHFPKVCKRGINTHIQLSYKIIASPISPFGLLPQPPAALSQANVMLTVTSDQNLFENDPIHFAINVTPDIRYFRKGDIIAQLVIPGKSGASMNIALVQLQNYVAITARRLHLPPFLTGIQPLQLIPAAQQMQERISHSGTFLLTAYAAEDFYPHLGGIPIVIVLTPRP